MSIPSGHHVEEFHLNLSFKPKPSERQLPRAPSVPGFYLSAAFANEGTAYGLTKDTWEDGRSGPGALVSGGFITALLDLMAEHRLISGPARFVASDLNTYVAKAQYNRLASLRATIKRAEREKAAAEQAIRDAGVEP